MSLKYNIKRYLYNTKKVSKYQTLRVFQHNNGILEELKEKDYAQPFFNSPNDMVASSLAGLSQIIKSRLLNEKGDNNSGVPIYNENEIIEYLIGSKSINCDYQQEGQWMVDLEKDLELREYNIYFNINGLGPLIVRCARGYRIYYRALGNELDVFINGLLRDFSRRILLNEPIWISNKYALSRKSVVLKEFTGILEEFQSEDIVNDAYGDLIRLSSIMLDKDMATRRRLLEGIRDQFRMNLIKSMNLGYYRSLHYKEEEEKYDKIFEVANKALELIELSRGKDNKYDIKEYYFEDSKISESNKYKIDINWVKREVITRLTHNREFSSIVNQVHTDIISGIFLLLYHLELTNLLKLYLSGSQISKFIKIITNEYYRRKPLLIKYVLKNSLDEYLHDLKEEGLIQFHQLENFFGYRTGKTIIDEVKADYLSWFKDHWEVYSNSQYEFIKKWAPSFFRSINYRGDSIENIIYYNLRKLGNIDKKLKDKKRSYMTSKGVAEGIKIKVKGTKLKTRGIGKGLYFKIIEDQNEFEKRDLTQFNTNKVIIKREELIKQRIVINSSMQTFPVLSKINYIISKMVQGTSIMFFSNSKKQKAEHYFRLNRYLELNKNVEKKYLCLPLDYSSYDHTITFGFIRGVIESMSQYFKIGLLEKLLNEFAGMLKNETILFKELEGDPDAQQKYKYGMLSGWKITSSVESIGNAIVSYGVMQELGYKLVDFETMGDDLIIILEMSNLNRKQQLDILEKICNKYVEIGFKMNVPKNSVGYDFLEFLRVTFRPGIIQSYPTRILGSLLFLKPGKNEMNFGIDEYLGVLNKICKRYGLLSQKTRIAKYIMKASNRKDIRMNGYGYVVDPTKYVIVRQTRTEFEYDVDVESTPIFKEYLYIFGDKSYDIIKNVIMRECCQSNIQYSKLIKAKRPASKLNAWEKDLILRVLEKVRKYHEYTSEILTYPDYYMQEILMRMARRSKFAHFDQFVDFLSGVDHRLFECHLIDEETFRNNENIVMRLESFGQFRTFLEQKKLKASEYNIPAIVYNRYKEALYLTVNDPWFRMVYDIKEQQFLESLLSGKRQDRIYFFLGQHLSERMEQVSLISGLPIVYQTD